MKSSDSCAGRNSTALNRPYHWVFSRLEDGKRFGLSARSLRGRKVRSESVGRRLAGGPEMGRREPGAPERTIPEPPAGNDWTGRKVQTAERDDRAPPGNEVCSLDIPSHSIMTCRWLWNGPSGSLGLAPPQLGSPGQAPTHPFASDFPSSQAAGGKSEAFAVLQTAEHPVIRPVQSGAISTGA